MGVTVASFVLGAVLGFFILAGLADIRDQGRIKAGFWVYEGKLYKITQSEASSSP